MTTVNSGCGVAAGGFPFRPGDHLWKSGGRLGGLLYDHHLIYAGACEDSCHCIIENSFRSGRVVEKVVSADRLRSFALYERPADPARCLHEAKAAVGERYSLLRNNCETFANRCVRGQGGSRQVRIATGHIALAAATLSGAATAMGVGLVATYTVIWTVPTKGAFGLWKFLGYTTVKTAHVRATHPLGFAAASGASCSACLWCCFSACYSLDPLKARRSRRHSSHAGGPVARQSDKTIGSSKSHACCGHQARSVAQGRRPTVGDVVAVNGRIGRIERDDHDRVPYKLKFQDNDEISNFLFESDVIFGVEELMEASKPPASDEPAKLDKRCSEEFTEATKLPEAGEVTKFGEEHCREEFPEATEPAAAAQLETFGEELSKELAEVSEPTAAAQPTKFAEELG